MGRRRCHHCQEPNMSRMVFLSTSWWLKACVCTLAPQSGYGGSTPRRGEEAVPKYGSALTNRGRGAWPGNLVRPKLHVRDKTTNGMLRTGSAFTVRPIYDTLMLRLGLPSKLHHARRDLSNLHALVFVHACRRFIACKRFI